MNEDKLIAHQVKTGRSLNNPQKDKEEYIERRQTYFLTFGIYRTHAQIIFNDFLISPFEFFRRPLCNKTRLYLYSKR